MKIICCYYHLLLGCSLSRMLVKNDTMMVGMKIIFIAVGEKRRYDDDSFPLTLFLQSHIHTRAQHTKKKLFIGCVCGDWWRGENDFLTNATYQCDSKFQIPFCIFSLESFR